jgi:hypothetical protein
MSDYSGLGSLVEEIKAASDAIAEGDARNAQSLDSIEALVNADLLTPGRKATGSLNGNPRSQHCATSAQRTTPKTRV